MPISQVFSAACLNAVLLRLNECWLVKITKDFTGFLSAKWSLHLRFYYLF